MEVLQTIGGIIIALIALMVMVVIHEAGHYTVGKLLKFKINEFAVGFGKAIFKKTKKNGEVFSLRLIPLGGYCAFEGEDEDSDNPDAFNNQKPWKRALVLISGALFNFISAILIIALTFTFYGDILPQSTPQSIHLSQESVFQADDFIMSIDGEEFSFFQTDVKYELLDGTHTAVVKRLDEEGNWKTLTVEFDGEDYGFIQNSSYELYAYYMYVNGTPIDGYGEEYFKDNAQKFKDVTDAELTQNYEAVQKIVDKGNCITYRYIRIRFNFFSAFGRAFGTAFRIVGMIISVFIGLFTGGTPISDLGGPVTVISMLGQSATLSLGTLMYFVCLISANLAVFNLLPIPSLDGSRLLFVIIEWIRGKPINRKVEGYIHFIGLIFVFAFAILVDLLKVF